MAGWRRTHAQGSLMGPTASDEVEPPPTGTLTFLFTDIEGSTRRWEAEPLTMERCLEAHDRIVRAAISSHDGFVFGTAGDGFAAAFARAGDAVAAATDAQLRLGGEPWTGGEPIRVRMGMHTGEAAERGGDYFGSAVNLAARLMGAGHGGQVLVSETTAHILAPSVALQDLGEHHLRDIGRSVRVHQLAGDGLLASFPPLRSQTQGNLTSPTTAWFGAGERLRQRAELIHEHGLVTLTGPGGVGKTRLALEMGRTLTGDHADGVWLVDLAPIADVDSLFPEVAAALSIPLQRGSIVDCVVEWMQDRHVLLVLDNCEHVLTSAAVLAETLLQRCASVALLATSREPLGIPGERVVTVPSLDPDEARALFVDRATSADDSLALTDGDRVAVEAICKRLDGIPLAIELAAARIRSSSPTDLLGRLEDRFRVLRGSGRAGLERHQTLRATVSWSYQLLAERERVLFDRLSVFAGSFDLAGVESVCADAERLPADEIVDVLDALVNKSMVGVDRTGAGLRYRLLETLRQYGEEHLADHGDPYAVRDRFLDHYLAVSARERATWASSRQNDANTAVAQEWDNIRSALNWAVVTKANDSAAALIDNTGPYAIHRDRREHRRWTEATVAMRVDDGARTTTTTMGWAALWAGRFGEVDTSIEMARQGIDLAPRGDHPDTALCWGALVRSMLASGAGSQAHSQVPIASAVLAGTADPYGRLDLERSLIEEAFWNDIGVAGMRVDRFSRFAIDIGAPTLLAWAAFERGRICSWVAEPPDIEQALVEYGNGRELARGVGDAEAEAINLTGTAFASLAIGSPDAGSRCREAMTRYAHAHKAPGTWLLVGAIAAWLVSLGRIDEAAVVHGHLVAHWPAWGESDRRTRDTVHDAVRRLERADELMATGADMPPGALVAYVLERL